MTDKNKMPEVIYLLHNYGDSGGHTWCDEPDPVGDGDIESTKYIRADLMHSKDDLAKVREAVAEIIHEDARRDYLTTAHELMLKKALAILDKMGGK